MALEYTFQLVTVVVIVALSTPPLFAMKTSPLTDKMEKAPVFVAINRDRKQRQCKKAHSKLRKTRSRMRSGYTARQYNGLIKKERRYKADITKYCN